MINGKSLSILLLAFFAISNVGWGLAYFNRDLYCAYQEGYLKIRTEYMNQLYAIIPVVNNRKATYMNGALIKSTYYKNIKKNNSLDMQHNWFIGTFSGNSPNYNNGTFNYSFYGLIDDMRIYNRALSLSEITALNNQGVPVSGTVSSMNTHTVTCLNTTTTQSVIIPASITTAYDCETNGLIVNPNDHLIITIDGNAQ